MDRKTQLPIIRGLDLRSLLVLTLVTKRRPMTTAELVGAVATQV